MAYYHLISIAFAILSTIHHPTAYAGREELIQGISRLNSDVIELRNEIERSIANRCDSIRGCYRASYDECNSEYTDQQICPSFQELGFAINGCGRGEKCNGLFDETITTVRLPASIATGPNGNPRNPEVVEAICYTRSAQRWMVDKYNEDKELWKSLGVESPQMYFGSSTGVFRIFPARHSRECGAYDPRLRPWYRISIPSTISNDVKPRKVVIIMDTSRSMNETMIGSRIKGETKLSYMKKVVTSTISTINEFASVAVIRFGEFAHLVGRPGATEPFMWQRATTQHKEWITQEVNGMDVFGRSNWMTGFEFAFRLIRNSLRQINATSYDQQCELENIAVLFFSDGEYNMPAGVTDKEIVNLVSTNVAQIEKSGSYHIHPFFYSIGHTDPDQVEKQISCDEAVNGYWSPVSGATSPANVTVGYQTLFATPLGTNAFANYTSWSTPYNFTSSGEIGYTVTGLVYNRDVEPPRYMGVVGMDIQLAAAQSLFGGTMDETMIAMDEIINDIKLLNYNTTCEQQMIDLNYCETQSMRQENGGNKAICLPKEIDIPKDVVEVLVPEVGGDIELNITDTNFIGNITGEELLGDTVEIISEEGPTEDEIDQAVFEDILNCSKGFVQPCAGYDEYPDNMWRNTNMKGLSYLDRVCCKVGTNSISDECPKLDEIRDTKLSDTGIFIIIFVSLAVAELVCCYFCFYHRKRRNESS